MDRLGSMVLATLCCASATVTGCGAAKRPAAPPTPAQRFDLGVVGITARIGGADALSSGFVLDGARGLVLTAAHGVWGARSLRLYTGLGTLHGRIVARAPCDDLAVLEIYPRIPGLEPLPAAPVGAGTGELLRTLGRRASAIASIPVRSASSVVSASNALRLPSTGIPLDSPLVPELSGGPVVDSAGRLVGMAEAAGSATSTAPAITIPWASIQERLKELRPGPRRVYVGWAQQYRCIGRQNAYARALHPGFQPSDARLNAPITPARLPGTGGLDG